MITASVHVGEAALQRRERSRDDWHPGPGSGMPIDALELGVPAWPGVVGEVARVVFLIGGEH